MWLFAVSTIESLYSSVEFTEGRFKLGCFIPNRAVTADNVIVVCARARVCVCVLPVWLLVIRTVCSRCYCRFPLEGSQRGGN